MNPVNLWYLIDNVKCFHGHFTHYCSRCTTCCFNSQVNIYLEDFQISKTVFILARFCPNKLIKSADKGCLILVPRSDLFRPRDFYGFDRVEISHFLPFLAKMQVEGFNFFMLSPANMGHFFLNSLFFHRSKHKYYLLRV